MSRARLVQAWYVFAWGYIAVFFVRGTFSVVRGAVSPDHAVWTFGNVLVMIALAVGALVLWWSWIDVDDDDDDDEWD